MPDLQNLIKLLKFNFMCLCYCICFRYLVADDRSIFLFKDGSQAWDAKEYLIEQERCKEVVIENKSYYGKHTEEVKIKQKRMLQYGRLQM